MWSVLITQLQEYLIDNPFYSAEEFIQA